MAAYGEHHVERLQRIADLQQRGLKLSAIGAALEEGTPTDEVQPMTAEEVGELLAGRPAGTLGALVRTELLVRDGSGYVTPSSTLLRVALDLQQSGVDIDTTAAAGAIMRQRFRQAAEQLVALFGDRLGRDRRLDELGPALDALRPAADKATRIIFAAEVERALAQRLRRAGGTGTIRWR
jgi:DNA-binding transcriptional MerR regulator